MTASAFLELIAGGACVIVGMCIGTWLVNRAEQRRHDREMASRPGHHPQ